MPTLHSNRPYRSIDPDRRTVPRRGDLTNAQEAGNHMHRKWWALIAVCAAIFMLLLDITIVNVALPSIQKSLGATFSQLQWIVDAYALTLASLLLTSGSISDIYGRRLVFSAGLILFVLASAGCALAQDPAQLIGARAVQGVGGAMMFATSLAILATTFHGRERGVALGAFGATTGLAVAVGPTAGGMLTEWANWQWIFIINVPIGIAALALTLTQVQESKSPAGGRIDAIGVVTFSGALFALVLALIEGDAWGWDSRRVIGLFVASAVLLGLFVIAELKQSRPMFDLGLLRNRTFLGAGIVAFTLSASMFAMFLLFVLYLQYILGYSPVETGVRFLPLSGVSFIAAAVSGRLTVVVPRRMLMGIGMLCVTVALCWMSLIDASSTWLDLLGGFILGGIGIGLVNPALASTAVGVVEPQRSGMASGINSTFRQVGIATGIAVLGVVFSQSVPNVQATTATLFVEGFVNALHVAIGIAAAGTICAFTLIRERDMVSQNGGAAAEPQPSPTPAT